MPLFEMSPLFSRWVIDMEGASGTLYEGEKFQLLFKFSSRYPFDSPQVQYSLHMLISQQVLWSILCTYINLYRRY